MRQELYWIDGPWPGKLAVASRPRGGDWLQDEMAEWWMAGVRTVLSLLTTDEERELGLESEAQDARMQGMRFLSLPIPDRQVPFSETEVLATGEKLETDLAEGKNVVIHCRQGIGRSALVSACLLISRGFTPDSALLKVEAARGVHVPETREQRSWIEHYAGALPLLKSIPARSPR
jgi:protein-tyrosine phosphatase